MGDKKSAYWESYQNREENNDAAMRKLLLERCKEQKDLETLGDKEKDERATRRRNSARNTAALDRNDPDDGITHLIYPPEIEAMVSNSLYSFSVIYLLLLVVRMLSQFAEVI
jgi:hypothetical protein